MAIYSMFNTNKSIKNQNEALRNQAVATNEAASLNYQSLFNEQRVTNEQASQKKLEYQREGMRNEGQIVASAAESGAFGQSLTRQIANNLMGTSWNTAIVDQNRDEQANTLNLNNRMLQQRTSATIDSINSQIISPTAGMFKIISAGAETYSAASSTGSSMKSSFQTKPTKA
jgi:hypothetical protein